MIKRMSTTEDHDISLRELLAKIPLRESILTAIIALFVLTRLWWFVCFGAVETGATGYFAGFAQKGIDARQAVYRDFSFEYPPAAWWVVAIPRLMDSQTYPHSRAPAEVGREFRGKYAFWFRAELLLADVGCLGLLMVIGRTISTTAEWLLPTAYAMITIAQPTFLYDALDIGLLLCLLLSATCWLRSLDSSSTAGYWAATSYLFLGLGISFKIVPVVFVPFLLMADLRAIGFSRPLAWRVLLLAIGALGPFLIYAPSAGWGVMGLFRYHGERGINLESTWGSLMLAAMAFGVQCKAIESHISYDLIGPWSDALKILSSIAPLLAGALLGLWAALRGRQFDRRLALDAAILALVNSVVLSNVYSSYYANWLLPLALLLALNTLSPSWIRWCGFAVLVAAICAISGWLVPSHYHVGLATLETVPVAFCVIRSACLVGLAAVLNWEFFLAKRNCKEIATAAEPLTVTASNS